MQRGEALVVGLADVGTAVNQLADGRILAVKTGEVKRSVSKGVGVIRLLQGKKTTVLLNRASVSLPPLSTDVLAGALTSTARLSRCLTTLICPLEAAACSGVKPRLSLQLISPP